MHRVWWFVSPAEPRHPKRARLEPPPAIPRLHGRLTNETIFRFFFLDSKPPNPSYCLPVKREDVNSYVFSYLEWRGNLGGQYDTTKNYEEVGFGGNPGLVLSHVCRQS